MFIKLDKDIINLEKIINIFVYDEYIRIYFTKEHFISYRFKDKNDVEKLLKLINIHDLSSYLLEKDTDDKKEDNT